MGKKQVFVIILAGAITFAAGLCLRTVWHASAEDSIQTGSETNRIYQSENSTSPSQGQLLSQEIDAPSEETAFKENTVSADLIQVRIDDGLVQWYDGTYWHTVATVEELSGKDKFYLAQDPFQAFLQELRQEKTENPPQSESNSTFMSGKDLTVGKKETPKPTPTPTPKPATPPPAAEESTPQPPAVEENTPAAPSTPTTPSNPTPPPSNPTTPSNPTPPPSDPTPPPSDGDGEDIDGGGVDWGNDYL